MNELAKDIARNLLKDDSQVEARVERGIEEYRKGSGEIKLIDLDGNPVRNAEITLELIKHEFHFGCNAFMVGQFEEQEENTLYENRFADIFNLAVVPLYWSDLEPENGKLRFDLDSQHIYRRPPVDMVLEFCDKYDIIPKGHPLCWHSFSPEWVPNNKVDYANFLERRISQIAERYGQRIKIWDVCNEAIEWSPIDVLFDPPANTASSLPDNYVELSFELAAKYLPRTSVLTYNDFACWKNHGDYTPMYMLARHLKNLNVNFGAIGLQFHMFGEIEGMRTKANGMLHPHYMLSCLDQYAKLQVPINISEITITGHNGFNDGDRFQKEVAERLYRLWFSHPAMNGIIWWNMVDGTAFVDPTKPSRNENEYRGGLLNRDLSPKPAYEALEGLIKKEWMTKAHLNYIAEETNCFRGFYGDYEARIKTDKGVFNETIRLSKNSNNQFKLKLK